MTNIIHSLAYFSKEPLKTEKEIEEYMKDLGVSYYDQYVEITIDPLNINTENLNKNHSLYNDILKAKEQGLNHFSFHV